MARLPLDGIRVTDFSWIINGPQIGLWLAAMGAEVIKIESQVYLDFMRLNPAFMADGQSGVNAANIGESLGTSRVPSSTGKPIRPRSCRSASSTAPRAVNRWARNNSY